MTIFSKLHLWVSKPWKRKIIEGNSRLDKALILEKKNYIAAVCSIIFSIGIVLFVVFLIAKIYTPDLEKIIKFATQISVRDRSLFAPEPVERLQFLLGMILSPVMLLFSFHFLKKILDKVKNENKLNFLYLFSVIFGLICAIFLIYYDFKQVPVYVINSFFYRYPFFYSLVFVIGFFFLYLSRKSIKKIKIPDKTISIFFISVLIIVFFSVFSQRIFSVDDLIVKGIIDYERAHDMETVFYSVSQVYGGKVLLINNFLNLYGLYPHFLYLIFKITGGLSILKFTFVMAFLSGFSAILILIFIKSFTRNILISFMGMSFYFIFYLMIGGYFSPGFLNDPYFQYNPIRLIFPTILIFLTSIYFKNKNKVAYYISFLMSALSLLWNAETGIVVFLTWILTLSYSELFHFNLKNAIKNIFLHLIKGLLILAAVVSVYSLYIFFTSGSIPDFKLFFQYQSYYYILGFNMIPMKLIHPWNIILLIYLIGLLYSIKNLLKTEDKYRAIVIFFLSILGFGTFSFYQGRSADSNLWGPMYSAIILLIIFADELYFNFKKHGIKLYHNIIYFLFLVFFILSYLPYWGENGKSLIEGNFNNLKYIVHNLSKRQNQSVGIISDINFIKQHTQKNEKIIILSTFPSAYYTESQTVSAFDTPGLMELFLKSDVEKIYKFLQTNKRYKVFTGRIFHVGEYEAWYKEAEKILSEHYERINVSKDGEVELYFPI